MKKNNTLIKNAIYNFAYAGLNVIYPLLTAPYVSRILGAENLGKVNFATSIVNWFIIFSTFGITTYGVREVSKKRHDKEELSKVFSELFFISGIFTCITMCIYLLIILNNKFFLNEIYLYIIMGLSILTTMFSLDWLYQGIEEYRYITIRNLIVKFVSLIMIFLFIKDSDNYVVYGIISVMTNFLNGFLNFFYSKNFVKLSLKKIDIYKHIKGLSILFVNTLVINLYTNLDQTLLGFLDKPTSVAFMNRSKLVIAVCGTVANSITNVALPRASYYYKKDRNKFYKLIDTIPKVIVMITLPMTFGVILLSKPIILFLGGNDFIPAINLLQLISVVIILSSISNFFQSQILIPTYREKLGMYSSFISAFVSVTLNLYLIPKYSFIGAGIAVITAEFIAAFSKYLFIKVYCKDIHITLLNLDTLKYFLASVIMAAFILFLSNFIINIWLFLLLSIIFGVAIYFISLFILKDEISKNMIIFLKKEMFF